MNDFIEFPKISRLNREVVVTEKIDGTNASVRIVDYQADVLPVAPHVTVVGQHFVFAGSRTRFITPEDDNHGFARWVKEHAEELVQLGSGTHFGEWWGQGINRNYGLKEKRFSLFNVAKWADEAARPKCCHVVPELWRGSFDAFVKHASQYELSDFCLGGGSVAAPGFLKPEGYVVYHTHSGKLFKYTFDKNDGHKGEAA